MNTFRLYFRGLFGTFFLKVFLEQDCNGGEDPCAMFGCNNDRLFPGKYTVKDHISNTKLEKCDYYAIIQQRIAVIEYGSYVGVNTNLSSDNYFLMCEMERR